MSEGNGSTAESPVTKAIGSPINGQIPPIEHRIKPGEVRNPGGMPRGTKQVKKRLNNAMRRYIRDHPGCEYEIAGSLVEEARTRPKTTVEVEREGKACTTTTTVVGQGWATAQRLIWDRRDGPLSQKHEHTIKATFVRVLIKGNTPPPEAMP